MNINDKIAFKTTNKGNVGRKVTITIFLSILIIIAILLPLLVLLVNSSPTLSVKKWDIQLDSRLTVTIYLRDIISFSKEPIVLQGVTRIEIPGMGIQEEVSTIEISQFFVVISYWGAICLASGILLGVIPTICLIITWTFRSHKGLIRKTNRKSKK